MVRTVGDCAQWEKGGYLCRERVSERTGASIGSLVRDALDRYYPGGSSTKAEAIDLLLRSEPVSMADWESEKEQMVGKMWGGG